MSGSVKGKIQNDKPIVISFNQDDAKESSKKPCIDFQPDERWHIKDDKEADNSTDTTSKGRVTRRSTRSASKSSAVNGESSQLSDNDEPMQRKTRSSSNKLTEHDEKTKCNNTSRPNLRNDVEKIKNNGETKGSNLDSNKNKRGGSPIRPTNDNKKVKLAKEEDSSDIDSKSKDDSTVKKDHSNDHPKTKENSSDDESESKEHESSIESKKNVKEEKLSSKVKEGTSNNKESKKNVKEEKLMSKVQEETSNGKEAKKNIKEEKLVSKNEEPTSDKEKSVDSDSKQTKDSNTTNDSAMIKEINLEKENNESAPVLEKECSEECSSTSDDVTSDGKNMPDLSSNENSLLSLKKEDDMDISIIEEKKGINNDSDDDIEIISSTTKTGKKTYEEPFVLDYAKNCSEEMLLSAEFPYFKCLKETIKDMNAGNFKPVKFPHTGNLMLGENEVIIESPSLLVPLLIKEPDQFPAKAKETSEDPSKTIFRKTFFQSSVGQFLINLGSSRVLEWYHRTMKHDSSKQLRKAGGSDPKIEEAIEMHSKKCLEIKDTNSAFNFRLRRCQFCDFKTESRLVLDGHYMTPHMTARREFKCNFCVYITRDPRDIAFHFEAVHGKKALLENQMIMHECLFCAFQSHLKSKVTMHMNRCRKNFVQSQNQSPPFDFEFPGVTTKPVTYSDVIAHRKRLLCTKGTLQGNLPSGLTLESLAQSAFARKKLASVLNLTGAEAFPDSPTIVRHLMGQQGKQVTGFQLPPGIVITRPRVRGQQPTRTLAQSMPQPRLAGIRQVGTGRGAIAYPSSIASQFTSSGISITPIAKGGDTSAQRLLMAATGMKNITLTPVSSAGNQVVSAKGGPPQPVALFTNVAGTEASRNRTGVVVQPVKGAPNNAAGRNARQIPPYQRLNTPPSQVVKNSSGSTFVMCEICDVLIKDLEELRSHMNWVHKVKIHPKMLVSRPPLNCQKCQWRFFTDQGLERHLLGAHGLVTTNMQEMANKNQDGGRCIICGAVFTYKLVSHMTQVHKVTLKPAHLSYKCTVCTATFTLYRLFESHVYNVHSSSSKRPAENSSSSSEPSAKKPMIETAQPEKRKVPPTTKCKSCGFITDRMEEHIVKKHMKEATLKICRINECEKCMYAGDEMILIRMSDFKFGKNNTNDEEVSSEEEDSTSEESDSDSSSSEKEDDKKDKD